ncbi:3'(2'),5'-bisphosphate nucleotidase [Rhodothalassium salexigens]|uniref:3'(2'),5'-bisphosphate nucleotidase CysQ n=1 Tax=Rhodothalassium salexigens TaxID=1086 RepID=UPI001911C4E4|nr:3'(2'),5'-bisphosphate nucleotidase CysQ [Rhodothalassium salexigens]MBK5910979.1 3'(2'),5'-bisphosphate nucleotidase [Rhodothalassium salexigens]
MTAAADLRALLDQLVAPVIAAGAATLAVRAEGIDVDQKQDASPVTEADRRAEDILLRALADIAPGALVVAEERASSEGVPDAATGDFWLVDPLDGTKEFIRGGTDFTVNVALVRARQPVLGLVYAPADGRLYLGSTETGAAFARVDDGQPGARQPLKARPQPVDAAAIKVVASRSHRTPETEAYLTHYPKADCVSVGSSLKFCLVAEGSADIYPRLGPTMEWDTAAGDAVLRAAGGAVIDAAGQPLAYAKPGFRNGFFVAWGDGDAPPPPAPDAVLAAS